jgi:YD repeat-containing protein
MRRLVALGACICTATAISFAVWAQTPASVIYTYDDAGRLKKAEISDGTKVAYEYDAAGNRTSMVQGTPVQLSIAPTSATEGSSLSFTVTKSGTAAATVTIDCAQTSGTATGGSDYTASTQTLSFLVADTSKTCSVPGIQDTLYEGTQTFSALLQNPMGAALIATGSAIGTITDNDGAPSFSVSNVSMSEGSVISFTIARTGTTELSHSISYATADGSATAADGDYTSIALTSTTFAPGQSLFVVPVQTTSDTKYESNETLVLNLSNATLGATITTAQATGTINNDDAAPSFSINSPTGVNEGAAITFTVTKGGNTNTAFTHSFNWATANNTAVSPSDYAAASGSVLFQPNDTQKTFQVQTATDGVADSAGTETFYANLSTNGSSNGGTISVAQGTGGIIDLDNSAPSVPGNMRTSPVGIITSGNYTALWNASTGPVSYYTLEREINNGGAFSGGQSSYTINAPTVSRLFNPPGASGDHYLRVKACSATNQCSAWSSVVVIEVCLQGC